MSTLPLSDAQLEEHFDALDLPDEGRDLVREIRASMPLRAVDSTAYSSAVLYPSRKMGFGIACESVNESVYAMGLERNRDVLEFYPQSHRLDLAYEGTHGSLVRTSTVVDFTVIFQGFIAFVDCKTERELKRRAAHEPHRWVQAPDGTWRSLPGEESAARYGLRYIVWSDSQANVTLLENHEFLDDYLDPACPAPDARAVETVRSLVADKIGIHLDELIDQVADADLVNHAIAHNQLYVDLERYRLCEPAWCPVFQDVAGATVWQAACDSVADSSRPPGTLPDAAADVLRSASDAVHDLVLKRGEQIGEVIAGRQCPDDVEGLSRSSVYRAVRAWKEGERDFDCGYVGLLRVLEGVERRGNTTPRLPPRVYELMDEVAKEVYFKSARPTKWAAHQEYARRCDDEKFRPASYRTFCLRLAQLAVERQVAKRLGRKQVRATAPVDYADPGSYGRHPTRPLGTLHLDHTCLDMFLWFRHGDGRKRRKARVWLTIAYCPWSGSVVGIYLSFDAPSYISCMGVLRDVVRRHGRLPSIVVVDNASEFRSTAFQKFCMAYRIITRYRPKGAPRYGSACERVFRTTNAQFVHNLMGNTQALREPRSMSAEIDPRAHVVWSFAQFEKFLVRYLFDDYANARPSKDAESPRERMERGLRETGYRLHRKCAFDEKFFILTLPPAKRGTAMARAHTGIQVDSIRYNAPELRRVDGQRVRVRIDPDNVGHVYAWVKDAWVECRSVHYARLRNYTPRQARLATREILDGARKRGSVASRALAIAELLDDAREYERVQLQLDRDAARRQSRGRLRLVGSGPGDTSAAPADSREPDAVSETDAASNDASSSLSRTPWAQLPNRALLR